MGEERPSEPRVIEDVERLEEILSRPPPGLAKVLSRLPGDLLILGVGGKMGPTLARMARRATDEAGGQRRVIGVSRFQLPGLREKLEGWGIETLTCDLLERDPVDALPDAENVIYMVGRKFGSTGDEPGTWAANAYLPGAVAGRFPRARILVFSTGNVYPLTPVDSNGPRENHPLGPVGEYAQSCVGRERVFEYFSRKNWTRVAIIRLNYAIDLRYGILIDVAKKVLQREPIDLSMGHVNVIWQGDANAQALRCLELASSPPFILNVTGSEIVSVRTLAVRLGKRFDLDPVLQGKEQKTALLSDATRARELFGPPLVSLDRMIDWVAEWLRRGGETYDKPTHYDVRDGRF